MIKICPTLRLAAYLAAWCPVALQAAEAGMNSIPPFQEVYGLIRSNLAGVTEAELNRAAVLGLVSQLQSRVTLVTNGAAVTDSAKLPLISKLTVFEGGYGFLRIGRVAEGLAQALNRSYDQLRSTNRLKGLVLDLRFAVGQDYGAAVDTADLFFQAEQPLLKWGETMARSTAKSSAIDLPLIVLINRETHGAAEALAAAVRQRDSTLTIGSPTAGRAYMYRDFQVEGGTVLRVASGWIGNGLGQRLPETGLAPDIAIVVNPDDEKAYFEDPYKVIAKPFATAAKASTNDLASLQSTNRSRRRINEAELVRMQREGIDFDVEQSAAASAQAFDPVINDPALARALDLLKGLALALKRP